MAFFLFHISLSSYLRCVVSYFITAFSTVLFLNKKLKVSSNILNIHDTSNIMQKVVYKQLHTWHLILQRHSMNLFFFTLVIHYPSFSKVSYQIFFMFYDPLFLNLIFFVFLFLFEFNNFYPISRGMFFVLRVVFF